MYIKHSSASAKTKEKPATNNKQLMSIILQLGKEYQLSFEDIYWVINYVENKPWQNISIRCQAKHQTSINIELETINNETIFCVKMDRQINCSICKRLHLKSPKTLVNPFSLKKRDNKFVTVKGSSRNHFYWLKKNRLTNWTIDTFPPP